MELSALLALSLMLVWGCAMDSNTRDSELSFSESALLVDVRTIEEFESSHIEGAKHMPYQEIGVRIGELTDDTSREIVLYCRSGGRSGIAQKTRLTRAVTRTCARTLPVAERVAPAGRVENTALRPDKHFAVVCGVADKHSEHDACLVANYCRNLVN